MPPKKDFPRLVTHGGTALPAAAWLPAIEQFGIGIVGEATSVPGEVARHVLDSGAVPAKTAVALLEHCTDPDVATRLATDQRVSVRDALVANWKLSMSTVDAVLSALPPKADSSGVIQTLLRGSLDQQHRLALWQRATWIDALHDAAVRAPQLSADDVADVIALEPYAGVLLRLEVLGWLMALLFQHPESRTEACSPDRSVALATACSFQLADDVVSDVIARPTPGCSSERREFTMALVHLADSPWVRPEDRRAALTRAVALGTSGHLDASVVPSPFPQIRSIEDWNDEIARDLIIRHYTYTSGLFRIPAVVEVISAPNVSEDLRRAAAHRLHAALWYPGNLSAFCAMIIDDVEPFLNRADVASWREQISEPVLDRSDDCQPEGATVPLRNELRRPPRAIKLDAKQVEAAAIVSIKDYMSPHSATAVASLLTESFGSDKDSWRTFWALYDDYSGTVGGLRDLVTATR